MIYVFAAFTIAGLAIIFVGAGYAMWRTWKDGR